MHPERLPVLRADVGQPGPSMVTVTTLSAAQRAALDQMLRAGRSLVEVFSIRVVQHDLPDDDTLPAIAGRYQLLNDKLHFTPHFPWEPGLSYRANFQLKLFDDDAPTGRTTLQFSLPERNRASCATVERIYPSAHNLPENLLRLYVVFSQPMQRGSVAEHVRLIDPDGEPVQDALYRAPVELWDRSMRVLTVLLDPGRLKRGVGPNRELGPPLAAGRDYSLVVGAGMLAGSGRPLDAPVHKRFSVLHPVREAILPERWDLLAPSAHTHLPLELRFPRSLDWALLHSALTVTTTAGQPLTGRITMDADETRWRFTPTFPWASGAYSLTVHSDLEDISGNSPLAPFDRPLRVGGNLRYEEATWDLGFVVS